MNRVHKTHSPEEMEVFITNFDWDRLTSPLDSEVRVEELQTWSLKKHFPNIIEKKISFTGPLNDRPQVNRAIFYDYQLVSSNFENPMHPSFTNRILIFIPGLGVSDFAFRFLQDFFKPILQQGYRLIVYTPPYHLERSRTYVKNYYDFFSFDTIQNISNLTAMVQEVRTLTAYLDQQGVWKYSTWGGSIGATASLHLTRYIPFQHVGLMIPIVSFEALVENKIYQEQVIPELERVGIEEELVKSSYKLISPVNYPVSTSSENIFIMAAEFDQLNSMTVLQEFAKSRGVENIRFYPRSHSSILLEDEVYEDYDNFIKNYP